MKQCNSCGFIYKDNMQNCPKCYNSDFLYVCNKCGRIFSVNDKICPKCHAKSTIILPKIKVCKPAKENLTKRTSKNFNDVHSSRLFEILNNQKKTIAAVLGAIVVVGVGINFITDDEESMQFSEDRNIIVSNDVYTNDEKLNDNVNSQVNNVQKLLERKNVNGKVLGTSKNGRVAVFEGNNSYSFFVYDDRRDRVAVIPYLPMMGNMLQNNTINFEIYIDDDKENEDINAGSFLGSTHIIPIYAEYTVNSSNIVTPGMIMTREGEYGDYNKYLYSQANVELVNMFLTNVNECIKNSIYNNHSLADKLGKVATVNKNDVKVAVVNGNDVFLRDKPTTDGKAITTLNKDTYLKVLGASKNNSSRNNYILKVDEYTATDLTNNTPIILKKGIAIKYVGRGNHGSESGICIIKVNGKDRKIEMQSGWGRNSSNIVESMKDDIWFNVELNNGQRGWIHGNYVLFL